MQLIARAVYLIDIADHLARRCWRNWTHRRRRIKRKRHYCK